MVAYIWPILLLLIGADGPANARPSETELKEARQLLMGVWELDSIVDNGEKLGAGLIRRKVASSGKVTIGERMIQFQNPVTGEDRVTAYRLDPTTNPRQIDVINEYDRLLRGIYRFEGDQLVVCLQHQDGGPRPVRFEALDHSNLVVLRLNLVDSKAPATEPATMPKPPASLTPSTFGAGDTSPAATPVGPPVVLAPPVHIRTAKLRQDVVEPADDLTKPTESEIKRAHELLYGTWRIVSVERDGETLGDDLIRTKVARDSRVVFGNRTISMASPRTGDRNVSTFRLNPGTTPRQIDVTTEFDNVKHGIYKYDADELWICLNEAADSERPEAFEAPTGSKNMLIRLRPVEPAPAPVAVEPKPVPQPSPADIAREHEETIRKSLVGSWSITDHKGTLVTVLEPDGSFVATRTWARPSQRLFHGQTTTSRGRWTYAKSWVRVDLFSSNDPLQVGRSYYQHVDTIGSSTLVGETMLGQLVSWRKLR